jgi:CelD/BcsL family acetyltransferase involved in cellulose biosynthesis
MRKGLRHRRNRLDKAGDMNFEILSSGRQAREALAHALALKRRWLIQRGEISTAFLDPATRDCLLGFAEEPGTGSVLMRLMINGEPAALRFGFETGGAHFSFMSAYDSRFAHLSPGKMLMDFCVSGFWERGIKRLDMLPPAARHKTDWCPFETEVADYTLPLSARGRAYAKVYQERMRPALKGAWYHLPSTVRSLAAALLVGI